MADQLYCRGNAVTLADLSLAVALGRVDLLFDNINWHDNHPNLDLFEYKMSA